MLVKICGLSTREHVQVAVEAGADAVGFVFADSVRRVDPAHAAIIAKSVPDTIKKERSNAGQCFGKASTILR